MQCDRCNMAVERVEWEESLENDYFVLRVFCHGEEEEHRVERHLLVEATELRVGRAFSRERLENFYRGSP